VPPSPEQLTAEAWSPPPRARRPRVWINVVLFVLTVGSVFLAGAAQVAAETDRLSAATLLSGWVFAVPLLSILLAHEFGHYIAARIHRVPA